MEKEQRFCQSCGMPLADVNDIGTNADGSRNEDYCKYCYENGQFTATEGRFYSDFYPRSFVI